MHPQQTDPTDWKVRALAAERKLYRLRDSVLDYLRDKQSIRNQVALMRDVMAATTPYSSPWEQPSIQDGRPVAEMAVAYDEFGPAAPQ